MNATSTTSLQVLGCSLAAMAVTAILSWSFIDSTSVARWANPGTATLSLEMTAAPVCASVRPVGPLC